MSVEQSPKQYRPFSVTDPFKVPCTFCGAITGTQCVNVITGKPLWKFVAHLVRLSDATDAEGAEN
jgi:hypothetical protein